MRVACILVEYGHDADAAAGLLFQYGIAVAERRLDSAQWHDDVSRNGTKRAETPTKTKTTAARSLYCRDERHDASVSRVLSHSYNACDTHGVAPTYRAAGLTSPDRGPPRSIMAVENGPSIDSRRAVRPNRATCASRMDGFIKRKALADRFGARRIRRAPR